MKRIALTSKEELDIYMSPTRQKLLRQLNLENAPMTPKLLADRLQISASGVQHHIKKLMSLGLIELDHTEAINGITASFYKAAQVTVQIGLSQADGLSEQKGALLQNSIAQVYDAFLKQMNKRIAIMGDKAPEEMQKWGDVLTGVVHLNQQHSDELIKLITEYIEKHSVPTADSIPWEYAIIAYNAGEINND